MWRREEGREGGRERSWDLLAIGAFGEGEKQRAEGAGVVIREWGRKMAVGGWGGLLKNHVLLVFASPFQNKASAIQPARSLTFSVDLPREGKTSIVHRVGH